MIFWGIFLALSGLSTHAYEYGIDRLYEPEVQQKLFNRRVGVLAHAASVDRNGRHLIDLLFSQPGSVRLLKIFVPEHGLRSQNDGWIENGVDEKTGLPVISLYKKTSRAPDPSDLKDLDLIVIDLQDVGVRYYTYFSTIAEFIKVAAALKKEILILDRPNPIGGEIIEGETLDATLMGRFISYHNLPTRHGMTLGELARLWITEKKLELPFSVIKVRGWKREPIVFDSDRPWIPPSPALLTSEQALLYALWGTLEQFNLAVGRGLENDLAFRVIAAPWISRAEAETMAKEWNEEGFAGVFFLPVSYTVTRSAYEGLAVNGVRVERLASVPLVRSDEFTYRLSSLLLKRFPVLLSFSKVASSYYGSDRILEGLKKGEPWNAVSKQLDEGVVEFRERRQPYLLYGVD